MIEDLGLMIYEKAPNSITIVTNFLKSISVRLQINYVHHVRNHDFTLMLVKFYR